MHALSQVLSRDTTTVIGAVSCCVKWTSLTNKLREYSASITWPEHPRRTVYASTVSWPSSIIRRRYVFLDICPYTGKIGVISLGSFAPASHRHGVSCERSLSRFVLKYSFRDPENICRQLTLINTWRRSARSIGKQNPWREILEYAASAFTAPACLTYMRILV